MFHCSKLPCLGLRSADFLQGFFRPKCLQEQLKHARSSTKISMVLPLLPVSARVHSIQDFFFYKKEKRSLTQGCQMACFQTKNPNLGKFWRVLQWKMLVYFMANCLFTDIWYTLWPLGIFYGYLVYFYRFGMLYNEKSGNPGAWIKIYETGLHFCCLNIVPSFAARDKKVT
jgi:hypothetical protein